MKMAVPGISESLKRKEFIASSLVFIIYLVGIAGMTLPASTELFVKLIPLVLVLSLSLSLSFHGEYTRRTVAVFLLIVVLSWSIEAAGVATGAIFGEYSYGPALGSHLLGTPIIIGLNWLLLVYGSAALMENFTVHPVVKVLSASALMVLYDLSLETAAPFLGMWHFDAGKAPLQNYAAWFVIAALFHSLVKISSIRISNRVAVVVFVVQFIFFFALALIFNL